MLFLVESACTKCENIIILCEKLFCFLFFIRAHLSTFFELSEFHRFKDWGLDWRLKAVFHLGMKKRLKLQRQMWNASIIIIIIIFIFHIVARLPKPVTRDLHWWKQKDLAAMKWRMRLFFYVFISSQSHQLLHGFGLGQLLHGFGLGSGLSLLVEFFSFTRPPSFTFSEIPSLLDLRGKDEGSCDGVYTNWFGSILYLICSQINLRRFFKVKIITRLIYKIKPIQSA